MSRTRNRGAINLGLFLVTLGLGWFIFSNLNIGITPIVFAYILIIAGVAIVLSVIVTWRRASLPVGGIAGAIVAGLILALFLTHGLTLIQMFGGGTGVWAFRSQTAKSYSGSITSGKIYLEVDNINGPVRVSTWNRNEYSIDLTIRAGGPSQTGANANLANFKPSLDATQQEGQQRLVLRYDIGQTSRSWYSVDVTATLPAAANTDLDLVSSNGLIQVTNVNGTTISLTTSNARLNLDHVYATTSITTGTSNAQVEGILQAPNTTVSTSNAKITLTIPSTISGNYTLSTSNGAIALRVSPSTQVGYGVDLSTSNANINVTLSNITYSVNQRTQVTGQTTGFTSLPTRVILKAITSNAAISVAAG
jgi:hypothetical protein